MNISFEPVLRQGVTIQKNGFIKKVFQGMNELRNLLIITGNSTIKTLKIYIIYTCIV